MMSIRTTTRAFVGVILIGMCPIAGLADEYDQTGFDRTGQENTWQESRYRYIYDAAAPLMDGDLVTERPNGWGTGRWMEKDRAVGKDLAGFTMIVSTGVKVTPINAHQSPENPTAGYTWGDVIQRQTTRWGIPVWYFEYLEAGEKGSVGWWWKEHGLVFEVSVDSRKYGGARVHPEGLQGSEQKIAAIADAMHEAAAREGTGSLESSDENTEWVSIIVTGAVGAALLAGLARIIASLGSKLLRKSGSVESGGVPPKLPNQPQDPGDDVSGEGRPPITFTDAAGRKHEYEYDPETGDYVNQDGNIYSASAHQESIRNAPVNEEFQRIQREKVKNRDTAMDRELEEITERHAAQMEELRKAIIDEKKANLRRLEILENRREDLIIGEQALVRANRCDWALYGLKKVEASADFGVDVCEGILSAGGNKWGKIIKYGYQGVKGAASGASEVAHRGGRFTTNWDYAKRMGVKSVRNLVTTFVGDKIAGAKLGGYNPFASVGGGKTVLKLSDGYRVLRLTELGEAAVNAVKGKALGDLVINPIKDYFVKGK